MNDDYAPVYEDGTDGGYRHENTGYSGTGYPFDADWKCDRCEHVTRIRVWHGAQVTFCEECGKTNCY